MAKKVKKEAGSKGFRKKIAKTLYTKMDGLLKEYESLLGEKKYAKHLKRAVKTLAGEIAAAAKKNNHPKKDSEIEMAPAIDDTNADDDDVD